MSKRTREKKGAKSQQLAQCASQDFKTNGIRSGVSECHTTASWLARGFHDLWREMFLRVALQ